MEQTKYPRISLRVSPELKAACEQAGPDAIRAALAVLLSDKAPAIVGQDALSDNEPAEVVRQAKKLSDKGPTVPPWRAKLDADRERLAAEKAAKDAERREREASKPTA